MPTCRDVHHSVARGELAEAGPWRRFRLRLHLLMCVHCRRYANQIAAIGRGMRVVFGRPVESERCERLYHRIMAHVGGDGDRSA